MYKLPELPYLYQDLEPFIDTHTMGLHYHKHEQNYFFIIVKVFYFGNLENKGEIKIVSNKS